MFRIAKYDRRDPTFHVRFCRVLYELINTSVCYGVIVAIAMRSIRDEGYRLFNIYTLF